MEYLSLSSTKILYCDLRQSYKYFCKKPSKYIQKHKHVSKQNIFVLHHDLKLELQNY